MTQEKLVTKFDEWWINEANHKVTGNLTRSMWAAKSSWNAALQKAAEIADRFNEEAGLEIRKLME